MHYLFYAMKTLSVNRLTESKYYFIIPIIMKSFVYIIATFLNFTLYRTLLELKDKVYNLSKRFSWILKLYFDALTLQSVGKLLNSADDTCVGADVLFAKLVFFWKQLNINSSSQQVPRNVFVFGFIR